MARYEYKIVEGKTQADIEEKINELARADYRLVNLILTEFRGVLRGQGPFRAVMERQIG